MFLLEKLIADANFLSQQINENSKVVLERRRKIRDFGVQDLDRIAAWQIELKSSGVLPLVKYFESWKAINEKNVMKNMAKEETQNSKFVIFLFDFPPESYSFFILSESHTCSNFNVFGLEIEPLFGKLALRISPKLSFEVFGISYEKSVQKRPIKMRDFP